MSLIHWDKSVLALHLREMIEDKGKGDKTALAGLGAILLGTVVIPATVTVGKPILKNIIKTALLIMQDYK